MKRLFVLGAYILLFTTFGCQFLNTDNSIILEPSIFKDSITQKNVQLIDVRTPKEYEEFRIPTSRNINYFSEDFVDSLQSLNPEAPVFIYCRSGKRSSKSVKTFEEKGFSKIYQLKGGVLAWKRQGFETISN